MPTKAKPKRPPKLSDVERHKRFVKMTREVEASEDPKAFGPLKRSFSQSRIEKRLSFMPVSGWRSVGRKARRAMTPRYFHQSGCASSVSCLRNMADRQGRLRPRWARSDASSIQPTS